MFDQERDEEAVVGQANVFTTSTLRPHERVAFWIEAATNAYVRHDFKAEDGPRYEADLAIHGFGGFAITKFRCDPCHVDRRDQHVARDACDNFHLHVNITGTTNLEVGLNRLQVREGQIILLDMATPWSATFSQNTEVISYVIPRSGLTKLLGRDVVQRGVLTTNKSAFSSIALRLLTDLANSCEYLPATDVERYFEHAVGILALSQSNWARHTPQPKREVSETALKAAIESNLRNYELTSADFARAAGMSVRYANSLLSESGTSLERYIFSRRLNCAKHDLQHPNHGNLSISQIAMHWGFADLSHFSRKFKSEFGITPSEYREICLASKSR